MTVKIRALASVLSFFVVTGNVCNTTRYDLGASAPKSHVQTSDTPPTLQITIESPVKLKNRLKLHWKLLNNGTKPIYVYSSLLQRSSFVEINVDEDKKAIEVRFLRLKLLELTPLSFPETTFKRLDAGEPIEGYFISDTPVEQLVEWKLVDSDPVKEKIKSRVTPGTWTVRCLIAYGYEIESVQNDQEKGHPIDPVVKWQKVAYSERVDVTIQR